MWEPKGMPRHVEEREGSKNSAAGCTGMPFPGATYRVCTWRYASKANSMPTIITSNMPGPAQLVVWPGGRRSGGSTRPFRKGVSEATPSPSST